MSKSIEPKFGEVWSDESGFTVMTIGPVAGLTGRQFLGVPLGPGLGRVIRLYGLAPENSNHKEWKLLSEEDE